MSVVLNEQRCVLCGKYYSLSAGQKEVSCPKCRSTPLEEQIEARTVSLIHRRAPRHDGGLTFLEEIKP